MGRLQLPLSGDVTQTINPWTWVFSPSQGGQVGLFNFSIDLGPSTNPAVEKDILSGVASYGKQLGRVEDALRLVIDTLEGLVPDRNLSNDKAVIAFKALMYEIDNVKAQHKGN
ncbi:hypothetical protein [Rhizobium sp. 18065]|uniref:hypothetical protein n=1 Tax=Rhizobium sp. 18065 TaxID=2681411 RepID=UPI0013588036|nr:hypothetical protein [Rhizobium sp. 18065]